MPSLARERYSVHRGNVLSQAVAALNEYKSLKDFFPILGANNVEAIVLCTLNGGNCRKSCRNTVDFGDGAKSGVE